MAKKKTHTEQAEPVEGASAPALRLESVHAIGPHQLTVVDDTHVTVHPVGSTEVWSCQPEGHFELRPEGTAGPYEIALKQGDRLVYAPLGADGNVYLVPFAGTIPN